MSDRTTGFGAEACTAQLDVYARALADATGETVVRSALPFLRPEGAATHIIDQRETAR